MCSSCIWIFVLSLLGGWGQMNQGIYWGHRAFCAWVSAWVFSPIPQLLTESSHYCTHKQGHLSKSVNPGHFKHFNKWSALLFPGQDSLCIKRNMYSTISAIFFILFFNLSVFIHCLWRKKDHSTQLMWGDIIAEIHSLSLCWIILYKQQNIV